MPSTKFPIASGSNAVKWGSHIFLKYVHYDNCGNIKTIFFIKDSSGILNFSTFSASKTLNILHSVNSQF